MLKAEVFNLRKKWTLWTLSLQKLFISKHSLDLKNGKNLSSTPLSGLIVRAMMKNDTNKAPKRSTQRRNPHAGLTVPKVFGGGEKHTIPAFRVVFCSEFRGIPWNFAHGIHWWGGGAFKGRSSRAYLTCVQCGAVGNEKQGERDICCDQVSWKAIEQGYHQVSFALL
jgi:hypothetical protein